VSARNPIPWHAEARRLYAELGNYSEVGRRLGQSAAAVWSALNVERSRETKRRFVARNPGYTTEQKRRYRQDPQRAERDRVLSRRWKTENRERNRARDVARLDAKATGTCACGNRIYDGGGECGRCAVTTSHRARCERIAALWHDGATIAAIADDIGSTPGSVGVDIHRMRADGWDLPYRRARKAVAA
jgi:hypothetical protein